MAIYYAAVDGLAPGTTSYSDVIQIAGSGTKTVKIKRIQVSGYYSSGGSIWTFYLIRRSSANTGGSPAAMTAVLRDTNDAGPTVSPVYYATTPSALGTSVGALEAAKLSNPDGSGQNCGREMTVREFPAGEEFILRGTSEFFCLNINSQVSFTSLSVSIVWEEI